MGNLLSFPLLCLQNYIAFRWCFKGSWRQVPLAINGDDIVFRSTPEMCRRWMDTVSSLGLRLSRGKTLVYSSIFSVNSHFFRALRKGSPRALPVVRSSVLCHSVDTPHALAGGMSSFARGFRGEARVRLETLYLRLRRSQVTVSGRSVLRDLRIPVSAESLRRMGWLKREAYYLSLNPLPLPPDFARLGTPTLPAGWSRVPLGRSRGERRRQRESQESFMGLLTSQAWRQVATGPKLQDLTWKLTGRGYLDGWLRWRSDSQLKRGRSRMMRCKVFRDFASFCRVPVSPVYEFEPPPRQRKVWSGKGRSGPVAFVRAQLV
jgi:hypothetical protein